MFLTKLFQSKIVFGGNGGGGGGGGGSSSKSSAPKSSPRPKARPAPKPKAVNPNAAMATSMKSAGIMTVGGKQTPKTPYNAGNPAIRETNSKGSKIVGGLDDNKKVSMATNKDGSLYVPYNGKDAHNYNAVSKANPTGKTIMKSTIPDNDKMVEHIQESAKEVATYNDSVTAPTTTKTVGGGGSSAPVTAPQTIDPKDGVGGGRDGGKARKSKASKTSEDKIAVKRKSMGISRYQTARSNPMAINKRKA